MKKKFLFSLGLLMSWLTLSSFTDGPDNSENQVNGHEYVDLGLPSGIKWATCNVGASTPEECGGYYAWGETEEKEEYYSTSYKWKKGTSRTIYAKYCTDSKYGDNKTVLEPEDDVAHVKWGGTWRIPTQDEQKELLDKCIWEWTELNGVNGYKVTGPNGNSIFLPAMGTVTGSNVSRLGSFGRYWSSLLRGDNNERAYVLHFFEHRQHLVVTLQRYCGASVRPVCE
ncbi:MAG: hypothetical protein IIW75_08275 [Bacteroidaceae bacterium]|nr:hypothetical protein [Bacteroidaceae bacterium]